MIPAIVVQRIEERLRAKWTGKILLHVVDGKVRELEVTDRERVTGN